MKFVELKVSFELVVEELVVSEIDFIVLGELFELGFCYLIFVIMNCIVSIFECIGFVVVEGLEIEDDWYNFIVLNMLEDYFVCDM